MRVLGRGRQSMLLGLLVLFGAAAEAHEPVARCTALSLTTIRCQGGYSDGSSAADAKMEVIAHDGRVLVAGKLDRNSTFTFEQPKVPFYVLLDVGPGHMVVIEQDEIE